MTLRFFISCLCWLALSVAGLATPAYAQVYKGVELVKADLLADTTTIAPGKPFVVGLRLKMAPRWHTYWQNSGDAGLPTTIAWTLPEGFTAGPIQWPIPERIDSPGDIVNYGYSYQVVLLTTITPPAKLPADSAALKAKAVWLVCAELCVPGDKELELKLPTAGEPQEANPKVFVEYRAKLPRPADETIAVEKRSVEGKDLLLTLHANTPAGEKYGAEFFPLPPVDMELGHPQTTSLVSAADGTRASFKISVAADPASAPKVGGVLVLTSPDGDRIGYQIASQEPVAVPAKTAAPVVPTAPVAPIKPAISGGGSPSTATTTSGGSLGYFLLLGLLGGLILNVMPCVLPVISLKVFSFIRQANEAPDRIFKLGLAYAAGVFAWFLGFAALIVILKAGGREIGYAFHLQNPWFIVGLSAAVFVFALNLLGVFEFILPTAASGALTDAARHKEGYAGAFFQGMLATVLGSACTAPFFGAALGFAFSQSAPVIFAMFAAIATGMSLPFVLLTAFPAWLRFLPKPGVWMERVKQATGFLMLATLLWLLSILGAMRGPDAVVWTGVLLLALGAACWVQGTFNTLTASDVTRATALLVMLGLIAGGAWLSLPQVAAARLPEVRNAAGTTPAGGFPEQLQAALQSGNQPVFIDFTAAWCVNCKANERIVLATEPVQRALRDTNSVFLTADWTNGDPAITAMLKKFGRAGVPLYVIYPADRSREPIVLPELLTQQLVLDGLKSASADLKGGEKLASTDTRRPAAVEALPEKTQTP